MIKNLRKLNGKFITIFFLILSAPCYLYIFGYNTLELTPTTTLDTFNFDQSLHRISLIYYTGINFERGNWKKLIEQQMNDLIDTELLDHAHSLSIVISVLKETDIEPVYNAIKPIQERLGQKAELQIFVENTYEFRGIQKVYNLSFTDFDPFNHYLLYFHGKGMFNGATDDQVKIYKNFELTRDNIVKWKTIIKRFISDKKMNKAGTAVSDGGFIWFNFWWARASYLRTVQKPLVDSNRWYYEQWLGGVQINETIVYGNYNDTLSTCPGNRDQVLGMVFMPHTLPNCD